MYKNNFKKPQTIAELKEEIKEQAYLNRMTEEEFIEKKEHILLQYECDIRRFIPIYSELPEPVLPPFGQLIKLQGTLAQIRAVFARALVADEDYRDSFAQKHAESIQIKTGIGAVLSATAGMMSTALAFGGGETYTAIVNYVEATLEGMEDVQLQGWLGFVPFEAGDEVEIAAEWQEDHYEIYAIARPEDRIISVCPNCYRGTNVHKQTVWSSWLKYVLFPTSTVAILVAAFKQNIYGDSPLMLLIVILALLFSFNIIFTPIFFIIGRSQVKTTAKLAENIFVALEFPDPPNRDLLLITNEFLDKLEDAGYVRKSTLFDPYPTKNPPFGIEAMPFFY